MEEEDLHWLYIFHYWINETTPKLELKESEKKYLHSDEYVFKNQLVFSIIEYCKKLGLKPFQEETREIFNKFDELRIDSLEGIYGNDFLNESSDSKHTKKYKFNLKQYLKDAERPPHIYDKDSLKTAVLSYLKSPIRNTYLDRFYLFHIIDSEIKEFYSNSNYGTRVNFTYNQLRTGLTNNDAKNVVTDPAMSYSTTYGMLGFILFVLPFSINILNNNFFNSNLLSKFYEYFYENIQIIFITYLTVFIIAIYNYINTRNFYKEFKFYETQTFKLEKNITTLITNILDQQNIISVRKLEKDIQKIQDNDSKIANIHFPHTLDVLLDDIKKRDVTTLPKYGLLSFDDQYFEDIEKLKFNAENFYRNYYETWTTLEPSHYLSLFVIEEYFRNENERILNEHFKYVSIPSKINKNKKLSIKNFDKLLDKKLATLQVSSFFHPFGNKSLKYFEQKKIISIKDDYIYERNFPKILYRTTIY